MKPNKLWFSMAVASVYAMHFVDANASSVVTSKTYVDAKISSSADISSTSTTTAPNEKAVYDAISSATSATNNLLTQVISNADTSHAPSGDAVYDALADKQNTIDTGLVSLGDEWIEDLPAVVSYDTTSGLVGNKYGILDYNGSVDYVDDGWNNYQEDSETNHLIPTVGAVGRELQNIWDNMPSVTTITWNSNDTTAVNNYSTSFTGTGNWPSAHEDQYVTGSSLAKGLALKQNKIPARQTKIGSTDSTYAPSVVTNGTTDGSVGQMAIITGTYMTDDDARWGDYSNNESLIPTLGAVGKVVEDNTINWNSMDTAAVNNYSTAFNNTTNNWPSFQRTPHVSGEFLANGLALKQNKIPATEWKDGYNNTIPGVVISTDSAGVVEQRMILDKTQGIHDDRIDNVVTVGYDDGLEGISGDIHNQSVDSSDVNNGIPTTTMTVAIAKSAANMRQAKKTCAGWLDGTTVADSTHTDANCVLWNLPD